MSWLGLGGCGLAAWHAWWTQSREAEIGCSPGRLLTRGGARPEAVSLQPTQKKSIGPYAPEDAGCGRGGGAAAHHVPPRSSPPHCGPRRGRHAPTVLPGREIARMRRCRPRSGRTHARARTARLQRRAWGQHQLRPPPRGQCKGVLPRAGRQCRKRVHRTGARRAESRPGARAAPRLWRSGMQSRPTTSSTAHGPRGRRLHQGGPCEDRGRGRRPRRTLYARHWARWAQVSGPVVLR